MTTAPIEILGLFSAFLFWAKRNLTTAALVFQRSLYPLAPGNKIRYEPFPQRIIFFFFKILLTSFSVN